MGLSRPFDSGAKSLRSLLRHVPALVCIVSAEAGQYAGAISLAPNFELGVGVTHITACLSRPHRADGAVWAREEGRDARGRISMLKHGVNEIVSDSSTALKRGREVRGTKI